VLFRSRRDLRESGVQTEVLTCPQQHELAAPLRPERRWICDGINLLPRGCASGISSMGYHNGSRFRCEACDYDLCLLCYQAVHAIATEAERRGAPQETSGRGQSPGGRGQSPGNRVKSPATGRGLSPGSGAARGGASPGSQSTRSPSQNATGSSWMNTAVPNRWGSGIPVGLFAGSTIGPGVAGDGSAAHGARSPSDALGVLSPPRNSASPVGGGSLGRGGGGAAARVLSPDFDPSALRAHATEARPLTNLPVDSLPMERTQMASQPQVRRWGLGGSTG